MKKACVLLPLVLLVLLPACSSRSADLQAGWYANIDAVHIYTYEYMGPVLLGGASFTTQTGVYGVFHVWGQDMYERQISVPVAVEGATPAQSLTLPLMSGISPIAYLSVSASTNYDSSQMLLRLWHDRSNGASDLVWEQTNSGPRTATTQVAYDTAWENGFHFEVAIVPEPSSLACWLSLIPLVAVRRRR